MNRTGLLIALAAAAIVGVIFGVYPALDLTISGLFYSESREHHWYAIGPNLPRLRDVASWLVALIAAPAFVAFAVKLLSPHRPMLIPGRAALLIVTTLALGPGLMTNVLLKDRWARPRPVDVIEFGGTDPFVPWWDPRGTCDKNCSFVAGEPSGAFWTLAPASVVPLPWRPYAYAAALVFGAASGLLRMAAGGHFFSDVVFAGVVTYLMIWLVHGLLYRFPRSRITDRAVERTIERIAMPGYRALTWTAEGIRALASRIGGASKR
jgi:lipid A 4'-phosphatase